MAKCCDVLCYAMLYYTLLTSQRCYSLYCTVMYFAAHLFHSAMIFKSWPLNFHWWHFLSCLVQSHGICVPIVSTSSYTHLNFISSYTHLNFISSSTHLNFISIFISLPTSLSIFFPLFSSLFRPLYLFPSLSLSMYMFIYIYIFLSVSLSYFLSLLLSRSFCLSLVFSPSLLFSSSIDPRVWPFTSPAWGRWRMPIS